MSMYIDAVEVGSLGFRDTSLSRELVYGFQSSSLGQCLIALVGDAVCALGFVDEGQEQGALTRLAKAWPNSTLRKDSESTRAVLNRVLEVMQLNRGTAVNVLLKGTRFQRSIWRALLAIPKGETVSYHEIAEQVGHPKAVRAVGQAVGRNPVALLVPCHRVIRKDGQLGGYRWGFERKQMLLAEEGAAMCGRTH